MISDHCGSRATVGICCEIIESISIHSLMPCVNSNAARNGKARESRS